MGDNRNASTTLNVYAHFVRDADAEAAAVLARLLTDGVGPHGRVASNNDHNSSPGMETNLC